MITPAINQKQISFTAYNSLMVDTVKKAVKEKKAVIHCAYSGDIFSSSKNNRPSIEHIKPHHDGGQNKDFNFLPVKRKINSERGHMPLPEYILVHPEIIENVKRTICEVARLKSAKFDGKKWAKEVIETFSKEAKTEIKIDIETIGSPIYIEDAVKKTKPKNNTLQKAENDTKTSFQKQLEAIMHKLKSD